MYVGYIYQIYNKINGKRYIGQTIQNVENRFDKHKKDLRKNKHHNDYLQADWIEYGEQNFNFKLIQKLKYKYKEKLLKKINDAEIFYIQYFDSMYYSYGYNIQIGGNNWQVLTKHVRQKISSSLNNNMIKKLIEQKDDLINAYIDHNIGFKRNYILNKYKISKHSLYSLQNKGGQPWDIIKDQIEDRIKPYQFYMIVHNNMKSNPGYKNCKLNIKDIIEIDLHLKNHTKSKKQLIEYYKVSYSLIERIVRKDSIYKDIFEEINRVKTNLS